MFKIIIPEKDTFYIIDDQIDCPIRGIPHPLIFRSSWCCDLNHHHCFLKFGNAGNAFLLDCIVDHCCPVFLYRTGQLFHSRYRLEDTENSIWNLLRAVEAGLFSESTKIRLDELESQKNELKTALAAAKLKENLGLKKEHILFFLHQFADMDLQDIDCQKKLIKTFVNSVFVYDDKVILTFNYSSDHRTITLKEIEAGLQECVRISPSDVH